MLIVVKDGDLQLLAQTRLDLETAGRGDVLEVDSPEHRGDGSDRSHDLVRVRRRQAERPGVDPAELLEEDRLAFHHRKGRLRADVSEPEHRGAVGDDRDRVVLDRQVPDLLRVVGDRAADAGHPGRVRHREVVARLQRRLGDDLELAAEVKQERPVGDVLDLDPVDRANSLDDALDVRLVVGENRDVADLLPRSTRTRSIAPRRPPASPIALASLAKEPGWFSRWTRRVALKDAEG